MSEQTGKHSAREDEQLEHDVRGEIQGGHGTRSEEWREPEPADESGRAGETGILPDDVGPGTPPGMTQRDVEERSEIARWLDPSRFPAERSGLVATAEENHAPDAVVDRLRSLDPSAQFATVQDVARALGIGTETRRT